MSTGTNKERITQNNGIISDNNADLTALKTRINNLPTSGDTTATANDIALGKTAVSKGVKITGTYTPPTVSLQSKDVTINQNGTTTVTPDTGYDGLSDVDVTVSGILDTSDATATADDIVRFKTAYVNGQKVTGTVSTITGEGNNGVFDVIRVSKKSNGINSVIRPYNQEGDKLIRKNATCNVSIYNSQIATAINLQANQIKKDETILGVTGTYEGTKAVLPDGIRFANSTASNFDWLADVDLSNIETAVGMFANARGLITISNLNIVNATTTNGMCNGCSNLTTVIQISTDNVTNMALMFYQCSNLVTVPQLNTSKVTTMTVMFYGCTSLSDDSLNNILAMCANSAVTSNKTLQDIGLTQTQAETCQTLSNWDAFVAAGWSSGY